MEKKKGWNFEDEMEAIYTNYVQQYDLKILPSHCVCSVLQVVMMASWGEILQHFPSMTALSRRGRVTGNAGNKP